MSSNLIDEISNAGPLYILHLIVGGDLENLALNPIYFKDPAGQAILARAKKLSEAYKPLAPLDKKLADKIK